MAITPISKQMTQTVQFQIQGVKISPKNLQWQFALKITTYLRVSMKLLLTLLILMPLTLLRNDEQLPSMPFCSPFMPFWRASWCQQSIVYVRIKILPHGFILSKSGITGNPQPQS
ncbi:hypothetical protein T06_3307 [Trichinella sp. T6]|nr:hypothetical protein T06_3307 [Trichinella sp. T6]